jgi:hypothetical protein
MMETTDLLTNCEECGKLIPIEDSLCSDCRGNDFDTCEVAASRLSEQLSMSKSTFRGWIIVIAVLALVIGMAGGAGFTMIQANAAIAHAHTALLEQAETIRTLQAQIDAQQKNLASLLKDLQYEREHPAIQALPQNGHVMNEAQCRAWIGFLLPQAIPADRVIVATVFSTERVR